MSNPPIAPTRPLSKTIHGHTRSDPYSWLEKDTLETEEYLDTENAYTEELLAPTAPLREELYAEMLSHIQETDTSPHHWDSGYYYYTRTQEGLPYAYWCRCTPQGPEEILIDENELAQGHDFFEIDEFVISDDSKSLAYTVDTTGYRQYTLYVKDLVTGTLWPLAVPRVTSVVWADNQTLYVTTEDQETKRSDKLWRLTLQEQTFLYEELAVDFELHIAESSDRALVFATSTSSTSTESRYMPRSGGTLRLLYPREYGHEYYPDSAEDTFFILTNKSAREFKIVTAPHHDPDHWTELLAHDPSVALEGFEIFQHHLVLSSALEGIEHLSILNRTTGHWHTVAVPESVYSISPGSNAEYNTDVINILYESPVTPLTVWSYDMNTHSRSVVKIVPVPHYTPTDYTTTRIWVTVRDGTRVPVTLTHRKDTPTNGQAPLFLSAYGAYGLTSPPVFSPTRLALLDRGIIHAVAHVRGGGELGEKWRYAGCRMQKMNTFTDFIDVSEYLTHTLTRPSRLAISGGSAGGLLMGAALNMSPSLFSVALVDVPFLDVLNTMLNPNLPLTTLEYQEWGNPHCADDYNYMAQYSPYDNIKEQAYPSILVTTGLNDSQVPYWEAAKFVARLRAHKTDNNPLLLRTDTTSGHSGPSGFYDYLDETALVYAFLLTQLGVVSITPTV